MLYGAIKTTLSRPQRLQNNLARVVLQVSRRTHAQPLLHQLHWLPVEHRNHIQDGSTDVQSPCAFVSSLPPQSAKRPQLFTYVYDRRTRQSSFNLVYKPSSLEVLPALLRQLSGTITLILSSHQLKAITIISGLVTARLCA